MTRDAAEELAHLRLATELSGLAVAEVALPEARDVVLGGLRLHYFDWGTRGCQPILFLHGGALTAHTWDVVCVGLRRDYHCLALDQRGHGESEWSPVMDYGPDAHRRDIEAFIEHLGLQRPILVGQSMGALNAFACAARHSDRLAGLVIVDAGPSVRLQGAQRIVDFVGDTAEIDSLDDFVERALTFNPRRDPRLLQRSIRHNLRQLPSGKWVRKHDMRHLRGVDASAIAERFRVYWEGAAQISCPALIVRGALSDLFLDEDAERFARQFRHGQWVRVEQAGHTVQGDNPRGLVDALRAFFTRLS